jgi:anti-sigma factor RsiW
MLIGKLLDGEISPRERSLLDSELQREPRARELLEQMRTLHECSCGVVTHEVFGRGADPEELFERAWQQNRRSFWRRVIPAAGSLRFATGVAAGLLLGLILHSVAVEPSKSLTNLSSEPRVAVNVPSDRGGPMGVPRVRQSADPGQITRLVDWYVFTDQAGNQWLIEGTREGLVKPAAYGGSL